jgi:hypothetical protein
MKFNGVKVQVFRLSYKPAALLLIMGLSRLALAGGGVPPAPPIPPAPVIPAAGAFCAALAKSGHGGTQDVNASATFDQNDTMLVDHYGAHNGDLCGPTSATHMMGGFGDWKSIGKNTPAQLASDGNETDFASVERMTATQMGTDPQINILGLFSFTISGTFTMDFTGEFESYLRSSAFSYGTLPGNISTSYSGLAPSNVTSNTLADPICQGIWYSSTPNSGYDYWKTQYVLQVGMFNINPVKVLGITVGSTLNWEGGHFIPLTGVWPAQNAIAVDNRQEGWPITWETMGSETYSILGIKILNNVATINLPGQEGNTSIILGYNRVTLNHGGTCPAGTYNNGGTCQN